MAQNATLAYTATANSPTSYSIDWDAAANTAGLADQGNTAYAFAGGGGSLNTIVITAGTPGGSYSGTMTIRNANGCTNTQAVTICNQSITDNHYNRNNRSIMFQFISTECNTCIYSNR